MTEEREKVWDAYAGQSIEFTVSGAFNHGFDAGATDTKKQTLLRVADELDAMPRRRVGSQFRYITDDYIEQLRKEADGNG